MTYYECSGCTPHNTTDHEKEFPRPCLVCDCKGMVNGEEIDLKKLKMLDRIRRSELKAAGEIDLGTERRQSPDIKPGNKAQADLGESPRRSLT